MVVTPMIKGVIFDLDSTLVDSLESIWRCSDQVLRANGYGGVSRETAKRAMGLTIFDLFDLAEPNLSALEKQKLFEDYRGSYMDFVGYSRPLPHARECLEHGRSLGLRLALVTTKSNTNARKILARFDLLGYFDVVIGYEDTKEHKPLPQPLLKAMAALGLRAAEVLVIGDNEVDVKAGHEAGSTTVAVATGVRTWEQLTAEGSDFVVRTLAEVPQIMDNLVMYRRES